MRKFKLLDALFIVGGLVGVAFFVSAFIPSVRPEFMNESFKVADNWLKMPMSSMRICDLLFVVMLHAMWTERKSP